jgi:hypothetical protein
MIDSRTWIWWRRQAARALLVSAALVLAVCGESPTETPQVATSPVGLPAPPPETGEDDDEADSDDGGGTLVPANVPLPFAGTLNSAGTAFKITQTGSGRAGEFVKSGTGPSSALFVQNSGAGGVATFQQTYLGNIPAVDVLSRGIGTSLSVTQTGPGGAGGSGGAGLFVVSNTSSAANALVATTSGIGRTAQFHNTNSSSGANVLEAMTNGAGGAAGYFHVRPAVSRADALYVTTNGAGRAGVFLIANTSSSANALEVTTAGTGRAAFFRIQNSLSSARALDATTNGVGSAAFFSTTSASRYPAVEIQANSVTYPALFIENDNGRALWASGTNGGDSNHAVAHVSLASPGNALLVTHSGNSGNFAEFHRGADTVIRFNRNGRGFFNDGTQTGGADVAEALSVEGSVSGYEPGDVVVISTHADRRVTRTRERYSTRVAGVYATKPGVLLTERGIDEELTGLVPVGVIGVIPTKVSAENGPIRRGDILVTASRPGHAMRATPLVIQGVAVYPTGAILGRALEEFRGPGTGRIRVLVNVR